MSFPSYPEYKDSGVEWLGQVPAHWDIKRLKYGFRLVTERAESTNNPIALENIESWSARYRPTEADFSGEGTAFVAGDILFGKLRPYLAKAYLTELNGEAIGDFHVLRAWGHVDPGYGLYYILNQPFIAAINGATYGAKMPRVGWDVMGSFTFVQPALGEQMKIRAFLDHQTARIDALIEEQQRLIELLKEKRQAVISHAVTKGLDPDVPMKDSGVEWLGEVPAHWAIVPMRHLATVCQGLQIPAAERFHESGPGRLEYLTVRSINAGGDLEAREYVYRPPASVVAKPDDLLLARTGATGLVITGVTGAFHNNFFKVNYDRDRIRKEFLVYFLTCSLVRQHLLLMAGTTTIPDLNHGEFLSVAVGVPPLSAQDEIVDELHKQTSRIEGLIEQVRSLEHCLRERRSALISAAVTGKIDVRGWQPPSSEAFPDVAVSEGATA